MRRILILLLIPVSQSVACTCFHLWIDENTRTELTNSHDVAVVGHATDLIVLSNYYKSNDDISYGRIVVFQVDSVMKGNYTVGQKMLIVQDGSNCQHGFVKNYRLEMYGIDIDKIEYLDNIFSRGDGKGFKMFVPEDRLKKVKRLVKKYGAVTTSICSILEPE